MPALGCSRTPLCSQPPHAAAGAAASACVLVDATEASGDEAAADGTVVAAAPARFDTDRASSSSRWCSPMVQHVRVSSACMASSTHQPARCILETSLRPAHTVHTCNKCITSHTPCARLQARGNMRSLIAHRRTAHGVAGGPRVGLVHPTALGATPRAACGMQRPVPCASSGLQQQQKLHGSTSSQHQQRPVATLASAGTSSTLPAVQEGTWYWQGHKIRYQSSGTEGDILVLVHGFGGNSDHWRKVCMASRAPGFSANHG